MSESRFKQSEIGTLPIDWHVKPVAKFCSKVTSGGTPFRQNPEYWNQGNIPWLKTQELKDNNIYSSEECITQKGLENSAAKLLPPNTVLMAMYGATVGKLGVLKIPATTNQAFCAMLVNELSDYQFLFYALLYRRNDLINLACGAAQQNLNQDIIKEFLLPYPRLQEQKSIAKILSDIDDKIALNQRMNRILEAVGEAVFKRWFVDFEFPNQEGKPYKTTGGKMVDSELGEIPEGWKVKRLDEISINFDSKRIPLSSREREKMQGNYQYFGAAGVLDFVNNFIFDGLFALMGEDGTVIDERGFPILQLIRGKFWVNNHAHVLQGKGISTELLFVFLKNTNIQHIVTGAVQPKINQGNMNSLQFLLPDNTCKDRLQNFFNQLYARIAANDEQNKTLTQIRDLLLPKLMSGKIRVPIIKEKMEPAIHA